jgi:Ciliary BBSome complex subunit 1
MKAMASILDRTKRKTDDTKASPSKSGSLGSTPSSRRSSKEPELHDDSLDHEPSVMPTTTNPALQKILGTAPGSTPGGSQVKKLWLDAWADPVAGVQAFSSCVHTCNLYGDGEWRFVVADADKKLKVSC